MKLLSTLRYIFLSDWENILSGLFDLALVQAERQNQIEVVPYEGVKIVIHLQKHHIFGYTTDID